MFYVLYFKVKATDAGGFHSEVNLKVKDKSDFTPRFSANNYEFDVDEDLKAGQVSSIHLCFLHLSYVIFKKCMIFCVLIVCLLLFYFILIFCPL